MSDSFLRLRAQFKRFAPRLRRFALVLTQDAASNADSLVAAAYESAWADARRIQNHPRLDLWLLREMVSIWRKTGDRLEGDACVQIANGPAPGLPAARYAVAALPREERLIIGLMVIERMNAAQAADFLHIHPDRAAALHARARRNLDIALSSGRRAEGAA